MEDNSDNFFNSDNSNKLDNFFNSDNSNNLDNLNNLDNSDNLKTSNEIYRENTIQIIIYLNGIVTISTIILLIMTLFSKKLKNFKNIHKILLKIFIICINLYLIIFFNPFMNDDILLTDNEKKEIFIGSILVLINFVFK